MAFDCPVTDTPSRLNSNLYLLAVLNGKLCIFTKFRTIYSLELKIYNFEIRDLFRIKILETTVSYTYFAKFRKLKN